MPSLTIRNLETAVKERLRVRAAEHGHSMEAEARRILRVALATETGATEVGGRSGLNMAERIHARFAAVGGVDLELPPRELARDPPAFAC